MFQFKFSVMTDHVTYRYIHGCSHLKKRLSQTIFKSSVNTNTNDKNEIKTKTKNVINIKRLLFLLSHCDFKILYIPYIYLHISLPLVS